MENLVGKTQFADSSVELAHVEAYVAPALTQHAPLHALTGLSGCDGGYKHHKHRD